MAEVVVIQQSSSGIWWGLLVFFIIFFLLIPLFILVFSDSADEGPCLDCDRQAIRLQSEATGQYIDRNASLTKIPGDGQPFLLRGTETGGVIFETNEGLVLGGKNGQIEIAPPASFQGGTHIWEVSASGEIVSTEQQDFVLGLVNNALVYETKDNLDPLDYTWHQAPV